MDKRKGIDFDLMMRCYESIRWSNNHKFYLTLMGLEMRYPILTAIKVGILLELSRYYDEKT